MPISDFAQIPYVIQAVQSLGPASILDVGIGHGRWGGLCREALEIGAGRYDKKTWKVRIEGVEIHRAYQNGLWGYAYDEVHVGNALELLPTLGNFDLILCCDLIEHLTKTEGKNLLTQMLKQARVVLLTSPRGSYPQGELFGNPHEEHKSEWRKEDFAAYPFLYQEIAATFFVAVAREAGDLEKIRLYDPTQSYGIKRAASTLASVAVKNLRSKISRR